MGWDLGAGSCDFKASFLLQERNVESETDKWTKTKTSLWFGMSIQILNFNVIIPLGMF
jgi:hypothetical protein